MMTKRNVYELNIKIRNSSNAVQKISLEIPFKCHLIIKIRIFQLFLKNWLIFSLLSYTKNNPNLKTLTKHNIYELNNKIKNSLNAVQKNLP